MPGSWTPASQLSDINTHRIESNLFTTMPTEKVDERMSTAYNSEFISGCTLLFTTVVTRADRVCVNPTAQYQIICRPVLGPLSCGLGPLIQVKCHCSQTQSQLMTNLCDWENLLCSKRSAIYVAMAAVILLMNQFFLKHVWLCPPTISVSLSMGVRIRTHSSCHSLFAA